MRITELSEGTIRDTIERALDLCPEAADAFERGDMYDVLTKLKEMLKQYVPNFTTGSYEKGTRPYKLSQACRLMPLIGLDRNRPPAWDSEEEDTEAA